jgi:hypothetical protein
MGLAVLVSACGARREANFADAALVDVTTDELILMPIVDQRENRLDKFEVGRYVRTATDKVLTKKGYTVLSSRHLDGSERPPFEGIDGMSARELANLGPDGSELLLFIVVRDVTHAYDALGEEYHVRLSGLLVDRSEERVLWRDKSSGDTNFFGFMSLLTLPGSQYDAVYEALMNLFRTVPDFVDEEAAVERKRGHS